MRLYLDDDSTGATLIRLLRKDGHDVLIPADVGMAGAKDQVHLAFAIRDQRALLTHNHHDFSALHDLVVFAAKGHHGGILVVLRDTDPRHNLSPADIARAVRKLENSGTAIPDEYHELNHWQ
jgi:hypothetical protein